MKLYFLSSVLLANPGYAALATNPSSNLRGASTGERKLIVAGDNWQQNENPWDRPLPPLPPPTPRPTPAPTPAPTNVVDYKISEGVMMLDIVTTETYNTDWVTFTSNELIAYKAISNELYSGTYDIRSFYPTSMCQGGIWIDELGNSLEMDPIKAYVASNGCDSSCYSIVESQLYDEFLILEKLCTFNQDFSDFHDKMAFHMKMAVDSANSLVEMSTDDQKVYPPPPKDTSWVHTLLETVAIVLELAEPALGIVAKTTNLISAPGPVLDNSMKLSAQTAKYANSQIKETDETVVDGADFSENDKLHLAYSELLDNIESTYTNLNKILATHTTVIASNYGKLQAFDNYVYDTSIPNLPDTVDLDLYIGELVDTDTFKWQAMAMLFPAKYEICSQKVAYYSGVGPCSSCDESGIAVKATHTLNSKSNGEKRSWMAGVQTVVPAPQIDCIHNIYTWICERGSATQVPSDDLFKKLDENTFAASNGYIDDYDQEGHNFAYTTVNGCSSSTIAQGTSCTVANMTFSVSYSDSYFQDHMVGNKALGTEYKCYSF